jgi:micrococcal nuclease
MGAHVPRYLHGALLLLLGLTLGACRSADGPPLSTVVPANAVVRRVIDGDTIEVRLDGHTERVRLIGIDTPESVKPGHPVECFAEEAHRFTERALPKGTPVRLVRDVEARDVYGRLLAYVERATDGVLVNLEIAREGYAGALTIPPNVAHAADVQAAVAAARQEHRGLWSACGGNHVVADSATN